MSGGARSCIVAAVAAVAALTAPATASAGGPYGQLGIEYESTSDAFLNFPGRRAHDAYDACFGAGERLIGIGGRVIESLPVVPDHSEFGLGKAYNVSIRPIDSYAAAAPDPDSTYHVAENRFPADPEGIVVNESTVCAIGAHKVAYPAAGKRSPGRRRSTAKVACPGGRSVLSGGVVATGPFKSQRMASSYPYDSADGDDLPDDGWKASVDNLRRKNRKLRVFAICSADDPSYVATTFTAIAGMRAHVEPLCPVGEYAIGGGVRHGIPYRKATVVGSRVTSSAVPATYWVVELDNLSAQEAQGRAYAICHA